MVIKYVSFILFQADDAMGMGNGNGEDSGVTNTASPADIAAMRQQRGLGISQGTGGTSTAFRYRNPPTAAANRQPPQRTTTDFNLAPSATTQRAAAATAAARTSTGTVDRDRVSLGSNNVNTRYNNINPSNPQISPTAVVGRPSIGDDYAGRVEAPSGQGQLDEEAEAMMLRTERLRREEESRRRRLRRRQQMLSSNLEQ